MSADHSLPVPYTLVAKLAAIVVHADEMLGLDGHPYDRTTLEQLLSNQEVQEWIRSLGPLAPVKRKPFPYREEK